MSYQHILLVTDLLSDADEVALKAKRILAGSPEARLSVLHIVEDDMVRLALSWCLRLVYQTISMANTGKKHALNWRNS